MDQCVALRTARSYFITKSPTPVGMSSRDLYFVHCASWQTFILHTQQIFYLSMRIFMSSITFAYQFAWYIKQMCSLAKHSCCNCCDSRLREENANSHQSCYSLDRPDKSDATYAVFMSQFFSRVLTLLACQRPRSFMPTPDAVTRLARGESCARHHQCQISVPI